VQNLSKTADFIRQNYSGGILMVSTSHLLEGDYPPWHRSGEAEKVLLDVITTLNISGVFLWNTAARVGSTAEILLNDRSFCHLAGVPILETGLNSAADVAVLCQTYAEKEDIIVELTVGDPNYWMTLKVRQMRFYRFSKVSPDVNVFREDLLWSSGGLWRRWRLQQLE
jgi:hypothetical protein